MHVTLLYYKMFKKYCVVRTYLIPSLMFISLFAMKVFASDITAIKIADRSGNAFFNIPIPWGRGYINFDSSCRYRFVH